jgi:hypothetical protein
MHDKLHHRLSNRAAMAFGYGGAWLKLRKRAADVDDWAAERDP